MTCYRLLLAQSERPGFLDEATLDQAEGAVLLAHEYRGSQALELWLEPGPQCRLRPANDNAGLPAR